MLLFCEEEMLPDQFYTKQQKKNVEGVFVSPRKTSKTLRDNEFLSVFVLVFVGFGLTDDKGSLIGRGTGPHQQWGVGGDRKPSYMAAFFAPFPMGNTCHCEGNTPQVYGHLTKGGVFTQRLPF